MRNLKVFVLGLVLCIACATAGYAKEGPPEEPVLVGRITFIEGQLLRYVFDEKDWVATVKDAPFGLDDALYSNEQGKAEFKLPNGTWVRAGADTQLQLIALRPDVTETDVAAGVSRFYNKSQSAVVKVTTPYGYAVSQPGTAFDLYVGDESAEIISLDGSVDFVLEGEQGKYTVIAGGPSIISDGKQGVEGDGTVDAAWDEWNLKREQLWTQRVQVKGESVQFLPPELQEDSYEFEQHGRWERVYYEGEERTLWRPNVRPGWRPFSVGRWTVYHEDNCWIPEEPYGYVTHHYGNWVYAGSWYWAPPVRVRVGYIADCACWYPGRVAWIHTGVNVGWVPLAPTELYYSHRYWGPATVFVGGVNLAGISINVGRLAFVNHAVIVPSRSFYSVNNYYNVRVRNINRTTIINNFRAAPVVNNTVIANYSTTRNRFVYNTNLARISAKPHHAVVERIDRNRVFARQQSRTVSAGAIRSRADQVGQGRLVRGQEGARMVHARRVTSRIVPANQVNRPSGEVRFRQRQIKVQAKPPGARSLQQPPIRTQPGVKGSRQPIGPAGRGRAGEPAIRRGEQPGLRGTQRVAPPSAERRRQLKEERLQKGPQPRGQKMLQQEQRQQRSEQQRQQRLQRQDQSRRKQDLLRQQNLPRQEQPRNRRQLQDQQRPQRSRDQALGRGQSNRRAPEQQQMLRQQGQINRQKGIERRQGPEKLQQGKGLRQQQLQQQRRAPKASGGREVRPQRGPAVDKKSEKRQFQR